MSSAPRQGKVIAFYSYKGGTGRSMSLANVATLIAQSSDHPRVLMVDWDLEAPGLHRYFPEVGVSSGSSGTIGLVTSIRDALPKLKHPNQDHAEDATERFLAGLMLTDYTRPTNTPGLDLMPAGTFDTSYSERVNSFNWVEFYQSAPWLPRQLATYLASQYDYVLIDSRTGITDSSGICTMLMPERLVTVFTPNEQSLAGVIDLVRQAVAYRRKSDDLRALTVFPVPSRVEMSEPSEKERWRIGLRSDSAFKGYQIRFQEVLQESYALSRCDLERYFNEVSVQHVSAYAYGEKIAAQLERSRDETSLSRSYERLRDWLTGDEAPWEDVASGRQFDEQIRLGQAKARSAEVAFAALESFQQRAVRRGALKLIHVDRDGTIHSRDIPELDLGFDERAYLTVLGVLITNRVRSADPAAPPPTNKVQLDMLVLPAWRRLSDWIDEERPFLQWRAGLDLATSDYEESKGQSKHLLVGSALDSARKWLKEKGELLSGRETVFIQRSRNRSLIERSGQLLTMAAGIAIAIYAVWQGATSQSRTSIALMKSEIRNLITAQEMFFADSNHFAKSVGQLAYKPSQGIGIRLAVAAKSMGWAAEITYDKLSGVSCVVEVGSISSVPAFATQKQHLRPDVLRDGEPACDKP